MKLLKDSIRAALLLFAMVLLARLVAKGFAVLDSILPYANTPPDTKTYLPILTTRVFVTVLDAVAILMFIIFEIFGMVRLVRELWKDLNNEKQ